MNTKYLFINNCREAEIIKNITAVPPDIYRSIFAETFIVKSINLSDLPAFVVASDKRDLGQLVILCPDIEPRLKEEPSGQAEARMSQQSKSPDRQSRP
jgi:hypothetical protein